LAHVGELLLLETCEARGLDQSGWLMGLDLPSNLRYQTGDEATKEKGRGQASSAVGEILEVRKILGHGARLGELAQSP